MQSLYNNSHRTSCCCTWDVSAHDSSMARQLFNTVCPTFLGHEHAPEHCPIASTSKKCNRLHKKGGLARTNVPGVPAQVGDPRRILRQQWWSRELRATAADKNKQHAACFKPSNMLSGSERQTAGTHRQGGGRAGGSRGASGVCGPASPT